MRACEQYLCAKGVFHYRNNSGATKTPHGSFVRFGAVGSPDIVAVCSGRYVGIECKTGKGKQTDNQKSFQEALERAGGMYLLVRSLDDLIAVV